MRVAGITVPEKKELWIGLTEIYGIGISRAKAALDAAGIAETKKAGELSLEEEHSLREQIEQYTIEGDLRRQETANIKRLKDIRSYRGSRHAQRLPARGQQTQTNSRTVRGNTRKTMGSGKSSVTKK
jgi:small subunit ribosomal protein S13